jgi:hypothetical protein
MLRSLVLEAEELRESVKLYGDPSKALAVLLLAGKKAKRPARKRPGFLDLARRPRP